MTRKKTRPDYHLTEWEKDNDALPVCGRNKYYILFYNFKIIMISMNLCIFIVSVVAVELMVLDEKLLHPIIIGFGGRLDVQIEY